MRINNLFENKELCNKNIFLLEDDSDLGKALKVLLEAESYRVRWFNYANLFLDQMGDLVNNVTEHQIPTCMLLDINLGGDISGFDVFKNIVEKQFHKIIPIIFITGNSDVSNAVGVLKQGAFDFLEKPVETEVLLNTTSLALQKSKNELDQYHIHHRYVNGLKLLTKKEKEILDKILEGMSNREIADILNNSVRTIEHHRSKVFEKLSVSNAVQLAKLNEISKIY